MLGFAAACGPDSAGTGPNNPPPPPPPAGSGQVLAIGGGNHQKGPEGTALPTPLAALARDTAGTPLAGVPVMWTVTTGNATVDSVQSMTGTDGKAYITVHLGTGTLTSKVQASAPSLSNTDTTLTKVSFTVTSVSTAGPVLVAQVAIPPNYGIHDTFVRDGLAFVSAWNTGVQIYDVGNGIVGGSPSFPVLAGTIGVTGGAVHNSWWFHNPNTGEKKYLFLGQEGPGIVGTAASGDIFVMDVTDLRKPVQVATFHRSGYGTHNFWVDEQAEILYAAYYNGGVLALDISGTLSGSLSGRVLSFYPPNPDSTYVWGVQEHSGSVYASDMLNGLYQLSSNGGVLSTVAGGGNVPERYTSELWIHGTTAYTGTWGLRTSGGPSVPGNALKIWQLDATGAPVLADSIIRGGIITVSDVEVSRDGHVLLFSGENGTGSGIYLYDLADPLHPTFLAQAAVSTGIHTATFGDIGGRVFVFGAKNPSNPALMIWDVTDQIP